MSKRDHTHAPRAHVVTRTHAHTHTHKITHSPALTLIFLYLMQRCSQTCSYVCTRARHHHTPNRSQSGNRFRCRQLNKNSLSSDRIRSHPTAPSLPLSSFLIISISHAFPCCLSPSVCSSTLSLTAPLMEFTVIRSVEWTGERRGPRGRSEGW